MEQSESRNGRFKGLGGIVLFAAVFVVPWFIPFKMPGISPDPVTQWLVDDYSARFLMLGVIFGVPFMRRCALASLGPLRKPYEPAGMTLLRVGIAVLVCFTLSVLLTYLVHKPLLNILPFTDPAPDPEIESVPIYWLDLTFGLALTAVSEELAFRSVAKCMIERFTTNRLLLVAISSIFFGLIHWSNGLADVVYTSMIGVVLMVVYLRMGSIVPLVIVHYLVNFNHYA